MNYEKHYNLLIERAKSRKITDYVERHHIVPRCMGGTNAKSNLVNLTPEEHYVAHQLLVKIHPNNDSLVYAANKMTVSSKYTKRNNKRYGWLKRKFQTICKKRTGNKNPSYGKSWYYNSNTLEEGKFLPTDIPLNWTKGRKNNKFTLGTSNNKIKKCKKCNQVICERKEICRNGQRIKRLVTNFNFNKNLIGTVSFYEEYDRIVNLLKKEYIEEKLSVEDLRKKYNISSIETMRCILRSLDIERRNLSDAVKNYYNKSE